MKRAFILLLIILWSVPAYCENYKIAEGIGELASEFITSILAASALIFVMVFIMLRIALKHFLLSICVYFFTLLFIHYTYGYWEQPPTYFDFSFNRRAIPALFFISVASFLTTLVLDLLKPQVRTQMQRWYKKLHALYQILMFPEKKDQQ